MHSYGRVRTAASLSMPGTYRPSFAMLPSRMKGKEREMTNGTACDKCVKDMLAAPIT